jgi:hypothetical protein
VSASFQRYAGAAVQPAALVPGLVPAAGGHVAVGLFMNVKLQDILAVSGFSNIVWMAPLVSLLLLSFRTREDAIELSRFIMLAGLGRALFGLVRWAVFKGDPNNVYANMNAIKIKLTFFDINDSLLCTIAFAIAAVNLFQIVKTQRSSFWRLVEWATLGATAICIVLSYRRSAWIGFVLAGLIIMMRFPMQRRIQLMVLGTPVVGAGLLYAAFRRLGQTKGAGRRPVQPVLRHAVAPLRRRERARDGTEVRAGRLHFAPAHRHRHLGPLHRLPADLVAGESGRRPVPAQRRAAHRPEGRPARPDPAGRHHLGLLRLHAPRAAHVPPELLGLATAGAAGLAFMLPDLLVGTPFPQVRTTQMLAICLALPYVAMACAASSPPSRRHGGRRSAATSTWCRRASRL